MERLLMRERQHAVGPRAFARPKEAPQIIGRAQHRQSPESLAKPKQKEPTTQARMTTPQEQQEDQTMGNHRKKKDGAVKETAEETSRLTKQDKPPPDPRYGSPPRRRERDIAEEKRAKSHVREAVNYATSRGKSRGEHTPKEEEAEKRHNVQKQRACLKMYFKNDVVQRDSMLWDMFFVKK